MGFGLSQCTNVVERRWEKGGLSNEFTVEVGLELGTHLFTICYANSKSPFGTHTNISLLLSFQRIRTHSFAQTRWPPNLWSNSWRWESSRGTSCYSWRVVESIWAYSKCAWKCLRQATPHDFHVGLCQIYAGCWFFTANAAIMVVRWSGNKLPFMKYDFIYAIPPTLFKRELALHFMYQAILKKCLFL